MGGPYLTGSFLKGLPYLPRSFFERPNLSERIRLESHTLFERFLFESPTLSGKILCESPTAPYVPKFFFWQGDPAAMLMLPCCHANATLLPFRCYPAAMLLLPCCHSAATLLPFCCHSAATFQNGSRRDGPKTAKANPRRMQKVGRQHPESTRGRS